MSNVIFITLQKEIPLEKQGIELVKPNKYLLEHYPYLRDKNFIYDFEGFNNSIG